MTSEFNHIILNWKLNEKKIHIRTKRFRCYITKQENFQLRPLPQVGTRRILFPSELKQEWNRIFVISSIF